MTLQSQGRSRERILAFGMEGVGKSLLLLDIATRVAPNKVHVVDNDNAWDRMLEGESLAGVTPQVACEYRWNDKTGEFDTDYTWAVEGGNVVIWHTWAATDQWTANTQALVAIEEDVAEYGSPRDWVGVDTGTLYWSAVQDWFVESVFNKSIEDYFMQVRMEKAKASDDKKSLGALDGWMDWPVINKTYNAGAGRFFVSPPCNLLVTAELQEVSKEDDSQTRSLYTMGVKPKGQKRLGHNMQSVVMLRRDRSGTYFASTLKDRGGREYLENTDITGYGFGEWYLEEIAQWQEMESSDTPMTGVATTSPATSPAPKKIAPKGGTSPAPSAKKIVAKG